jgi:hypothetical protein
MAFEPKFIKGDYIKFNGYTGIYLDSCLVIGYSFSHSAYVLQCVINGNKNTEIMKKSYVEEHAKLVPYIITPLWRILAGA